MIQSLLIIRPPDVLPDHRSLKNSTTHKTDESPVNPLCEKCYDYRLRIRQDLCGIKQETLTSRVGKT
jgi:hypothetical protein